MRIFIAHTVSKVEADLASEIAVWLRAKGHQAYAGGEIPYEALSFTRHSIFDESIREFLERSDLLIALFIDSKGVKSDTGRYGNLEIEIGYFLRKAERDRLILIQSESAKVSPALKSSYTIELSDPKRNRLLMFKELNKYLDIFTEKNRKQKRQIFLSYAKEDFLSAKNLYSKLNSEGYNIWLDKVRLIVGEEWDSKIIRAIQDSVAFIPCFSKHSVDKKGYFQKELRRSLQVAEEFPEGAIFILPVRFDECEVPFSFKKYQWCDLHDLDGFNRLIIALEKATEETN